MSIKKNLIANYLGYGWNGLMQIVFVPAYIYYLGIESYGLIGVYTMLLSFLPLADMGISTTLNREMSRYKAGAHSKTTIRNLVHTLEIVCVFVTGVVIMAIAAVSGIIAEWWVKPENLSTNEIQNAIMYMGIVVGFRLMEGLYRGGLLGIQKQVWLNAASSIISTIRGGGAIVVLAAISARIESFFVWQGIVSGISILIYFIGFHRCLPRDSTRARFSVTTLKNVWKFATGIIITTGLAVLLTQIDKIVLSKLLTLEEFGIYAFATTVASVLYQLVGPVNQTYYPKFTELFTQGKESELIYAYHQGTQLVSVFMGTVAFALINFGDTILEIWTTNAELSQRVFPLMRILTVGTMLNGIMNVPYMLQLASGWSSLAAKVNFVSVLLIVPGVLVFVPQYGAVSAAWIWVALNSAYILVTINIMHRKILPTEKCKWYLKDNALPIIATVTIQILSKNIMPEMEIAFTIIWIVLTVGIAALVSLAFSDVLSATVIRMIKKVHE